MYEMQGYEQFRDTGYWDMVCTGVEDVVKEILIKQSRVLYQLCPLYLQIKPHLGVPATPKSCSLKYIGVHSSLASVITEIIYTQVYTSVLSSSA